jgi:hypothetical protein
LRESRANTLATAVDSIVQARKLSLLPPGLHQLLQVDFDRLAKLRQIGIEARQGLRFAEQARKRLGIRFFGFERLQRGRYMSGTLGLNATLLAVNNRIHRREDQFQPGKPHVSDRFQAALRDKRPFERLLGSAFLIPAHRQHRAEAEQGRARKRCQSLADGKIAFGGRAFVHGRKSPYNDLPLRAWSSVAVDAESRTRSKPDDVMSKRSGVLLRSDRLWQIDLNHLLKHGPHSADEPPRMLLHVSLNRSRFKDKNMQHLKVLQRPYSAVRPLGRHSTRLGAIMML